MSDAQRELPVILKLYDVMLWTMQHMAKFPRHHHRVSKYFIAASG